MSTLKVDTIRDSGSGFNDVVTFANSDGTENGRLCRAFVNFNGQGAVAIRANFNVNSITDNGTGHYTVNFANAMSDASFSSVGTADGMTIPGSHCFIYFDSHTSSGVSLQQTSPGGSRVDGIILSVAIFR